MAQPFCACQNGNCKPGGDALHGLHRRDDDALNERPVVGRPPRRTPAVNSSPLQFSGFSVVPSRDIRATCHAEALA